MSNDPGATRTSPCSWPWCRSETVAEIGLTPITAHLGDRTHLRVPPDELVVYLVAVDDGPPRVVVESVSDEGTTPVLLLRAEEAAGLAAGLLASVDTAVAGTARQAR